MSLERAVTLVDLLAHRAREDPDAPYFELFGERVTVGDLWEASRRCAAGLARVGLRPGDRLALVLPTCREFFEVFFGAMALGVVPVPLYPTLGPDALAGIFRRARIRAAVTISWFEATTRAAATGLTPALVLLEPHELGRPAPEPAWPALTGEETAFLQYTSGSTAEPRGVDLPHRAVLANIRSFMAAAAPRPGEAAVSWLPLYHDMGLIGLGLGCLYSRVRLYLLPPDLRDPRPWLETLTRTRAAFTASPDFGYRNCLRRVTDPGGYDLSGLRLAITGAEPVRAETVEAFEARFGLRHVVVPAYGLAEATLAVTMGEPGRPLRVDAAGRVGVGRPVPGVQVAIWQEGADGGAGRFLPPGEVGEIVVRTPGAMRGYDGDPEATRHAFRSGWLHTGDLGYLAPDGELFVVGRQKELIILRGENLAPHEVERIVDAVPGIRYSAAVGLPSARVGTERLVVVAEVREPLPTPEEASRLVRRIVAAVRAQRALRPGRVLLVRPGTIPKTSSGKIQHGRLAALLAAGALADAVLYPRRAGRPAGIAEDGA